MYQGFRHFPCGSGRISFVGGCLALLATGCGTTFPEYSGRMANENSNNHVKPYQGASTSNDGNSEAVRPIARIPAAGQLAIHLNEAN